jgi:hypothetical protein
MKVSYSSMSGALSKEVSSAGLTDGNFAPGAVYDASKGGVRSEFVNPGKRSRAAALVDPARNGSPELSFALLYGYATTI